MMHHSKIGCELHSINDGHAINLGVQTNRTARNHESAMAFSYSNTNI
jgi:hypothetical protein